MNYRRSTHRLTRNLTHRQAIRHPPASLNLNDPANVGGTLARKSKSVAWIIAVQLALLSGCLSDSNNLSCSTKGPSQDDQKCVESSHAPMGVIGDSTQPAAGAVNDLQIGAYYYLWYDAEPHPKHWRDGYVMAELDNPIYPLGGEYSSADHGVIDRQIATAKAHLIDFFLVSWWGQNSLEDSNFKDHFVQRAEAADFKYCLFYESIAGNTLADEFPFFEDNNAVEQQFISDMLYIATDYFSSPNYLKINGKPVLAFYVARNFRGNWQASLQKARDAIRDATGFETYLIADVVAWQQKLDLEFLAGFDAITPYTMYDNQQDQDNAEILNADDIWFTQDVTHYYDVSSRWAAAFDRAFIPNVQPGFNDRGVRLAADHYILTEELNDTHAREHSLFRKYLDIAGNFVDDESGLLFVTSWNEWHENTQIEPTGYNSDSTGPWEYTQGWKYYDYGFERLQVLKDFVEAYPGKTTIAPDADLVLNEIAPQAMGGKFVEIYNKEDRDVNLDGWRMGIELHQERWQRKNAVIHLEGTIRANSFFVVANAAFSGHADQVVSNGLLDRLRRDNAQIALRDPKGVAADAVGYRMGASFYGWYVEGDSKVLSAELKDLTLNRDASSSDSNNNDRDFGVDQPTPGTANRAPESVLLINSDEIIRSGETRSFPNFSTHLTLQPDGNLVLRAGLPGSAGRAIWATGTSVGMNDYFAILQRDGNLVIYRGTPDAPGTPVYASHSNDEPGDYHLALTNDDKLFIRKGTMNHPGPEVWSNTKPLLRRGQILQEGELLKVGHINSFLMAQSDGNLVCYRGTGMNDSHGAVWASGSQGSADDYYLNLQRDGNIVLYEGTPLAPGLAIWSVHLGTDSDYFMTIAYDHFPVVYEGSPESPGQVLWKAGSM